MKELTQAARDNLASGATSGPGTYVCAGCDGPKPETRLNSARCAACGKGGTGKSTSASPVRVIRATLPVDVAERFAAEASEKGYASANLFLIDLIITRDTRKHNTTDGASD